MVDIGYFYFLTRQNGNGCTKVLQFTTVKRWEWRPTYPPQKVARSIPKSCSSKQMKEKQETERSAATLFRLPKPQK